MLRVVRLVLGGARIGVGRQGSSRWWEVCQAEVVFVGECLRCWGRGCYGRRRLQGWFERVGAGGGLCVEGLEVAKAEGCKVVEDGSVGVVGLGGGGKVEDECVEEEGEFPEGLSRGLVAGVVG